MNKHSICYLIPRDNFLKILLPIYFNQNQNIPNSKKIIFLPSNENIFSSKNNTLLTKEKIHKFVDKSDFNIFVFNSLEDILKGFIKFKITHVFLVNPKQNSGFIERIIMPSKKDLGIKWCVIGFTGDELFQLENENEKNLKIWDLICPGTNFAKKKFLASLRLKKNSYDLINFYRKTKVISNPVLSQIKILQSKEYLLEKFKIPNNKKIILVTSLSLFGLKFNKLFINNIFFNFLQISFIFKIINFFSKCMKLNVNTNIYKFLYSKKIFQLIKLYAEKNNALVLYKRRAKDYPITSWEKNFADYIFEDNSFYPFTTSELIKISDLYIGFCSFTTFEALSQGIPTINLITTHELFSKFQMLRSCFFNLWIKKRIQIKNSSHIFNLLSKDDLKLFKDLINRNHNFFQYDKVAVNLFLKKYYCDNHLDASTNFFNIFKSFNL